MIVEPSEFDLIVVGTGLQESLIAGAAAKAGKTVLHLDASGLYGDLWAGLTLEEYANWAEAHKRSWKSRAVGPQGESGDARNPAECDDRQYAALVVENCNDVYKNVTTESSEGFDIARERGYVVDLVPKVTYCSGALVSALVEAKAHQYTDYRLLDESYVWSDGMLVKVPASRSDVFKDRTLDASEKRILTLFLKKVVGELEKQMLGAKEGVSFEGGNFREWLKAEGLSEKLADMIYYSIALKEVGQSNLTVQEGFEGLSLYLRSIGRYKPDSSPFMLPQYGCSDVPQAFCRTCAVNGGIYVLRCGINSVLLEDGPSGNRCAGVTTHYGQQILCKKLVLPGHLTGIYSGPGEDADGDWISRGLCVTDISLQEGKSQILVVIPPGCLGGNSECVKILQLGPPTCPEGRFLIHLSALSDGKSSAKDDLWPVVQTLLNTQTSSHTQNPTTSLEDTRPKLLWSSFHSQATNLDCQEGSSAPENVVCCGLPGGMIGYGADVELARGLFGKLFPDLEFLSCAELNDRILVDSDEDMLDDLEAELSNLGVA
ncbi:hypothetical protein BSKO_08885 [Bryopsis sp. KO-2023]|nr:hypothetical protein BSKO_08885 [Bryopsis sp. KO-2023]